MTSVCLLPKTVLPGTHQQVEMKDIKWKCVDHRCGACWYPDSNNHPDIYICWGCRCLMALCCVSCFVTVGRSRLIRIDLFIDGRQTYTWDFWFLVPDVRGVEQNFHDVTIVDMDEECEPKVTFADLTHLRDSWPPGIFNHMKWFQPCKYCGKVIRCNMYRHMARLHLDLAQLWRCPVSWCTVWRGTPQDCMEHLRNGHDVPWISKTASIERFVPPWTVRREL